MEAISISDWSNYLAAESGADATLTGLVFVAMSINLSRVLSTPGLTGRAAESLLQLFGALMVSTCGLIPRQPAVALGAEVLAIGLTLWCIGTGFQIYYIRRNPGNPWRWVASRILNTHVSNVPFCIAGLLLMRGSAAGMYWLAPGFIFSLFAGLLGAWVLLVEILR